MLDDPVTQRVRKSRHAISREHDHDPIKLVEYYLQRQKEHKDRLKRQPDRVAPYSGRQSQ